MKYHTRISRIADLLGKKKSVFLLGPRGSGKSTYLAHFLNSLRHETFTINLLETDTFRTYLQAPHLLRKQVEFKLKSCELLYVLIDEIQKVPQLLDEVHLLLERFKESCVFVLTGSSARKLKQEHVNLLAGRAIRLSFFPFSFEEVDANSKLDDVLQYGLLPEAYLEKDQDIVVDYLKTYTGTYLKEEVMQESLRRNIQGFSSFLELAAFANGSPVNYSKMARQTNVSDQTVKSHYQILEDTLMVHRVPAWTFSPRKQLQKAAKFYFFDNGVINALTGELRTELRESSFRYGHLFENFIVNEIIKYNQTHDYDYHMYHYRTNHGQEIDMILQKNVKSPPVAIEIKSSQTPSCREVKALTSFLAENQSARGCVLCRTREAFEENNITFYPFAEGIRQVFELVDSE